MCVAGFNSISVSVSVIFDCQLISIFDFRFSGYLRFQVSSLNGRRLLEEQDKVLRSYFAQKGGTRGQRRGGTHDQGREHVKWDMYV